MKKFVLSFLVAGLIITSVLSLGSCKKTDTNSTTNTEEWIPTVYEVIYPNDLQIKEEPPVYCYYCLPDTVLIHRCEDPIQWVNEAFYCPQHSHVHYFNATDNCYSPTQLYCQYRGVRNHYHIMTYHGWYWHGSHVGGGAGSGD